MKQWVARGRTARREPGTMNKLEAAYAEHLELRRIAGEILWYRYEGIKLRLAPKTFLTPDFFVMVASGDLEVHEVKGGFFEDDARVKIKVAAEAYPFRFVVVRRPRVRDPWQYEEVA